jgi:hypothetical protein
MKRVGGVINRHIFKVAFLIAACAAVSVATSCFSPVGSIGGGSASSDDLFWAQPSRVAYEMNDLFIRNGDLEVFTSYMGVVQSIPLNSVKIGIAEKPDNAPNDIEYIPLDENYALKTKGRKLVVVEYNKMSTAYSIEVLDPFGIGGGGGGQGGGPGIEIVWETPVVLPKP